MCLYVRVLVFSFGMGVVLAHVILRRGYGLNWLFIICTRALN